VGKKATTMRSTRKKVFGNKKKKEQLKAKRELKRQKELDGGGGAPPCNRKNQRTPRAKEEEQSENHAPKEADCNKLRTVFEKESKEEVEARKKRAQEPLCRWQARKASDYFYKQFIGMPKRPPWSYAMSKQQLEEREKKYFDSWLHTIYDHYPRERLNYFEHNLEVWRQLWRVIERSDILVIVADSRHPLFHFPPSLYIHVVEDHKKPIMLVLNKIDLVPGDVLQRWVTYFEERYPLLKVVCFTSYPNEETVTLGKDSEIDVERKRKKRIRRKYRAVGGKELIELAARFARERGLMSEASSGGEEEEKEKEDEENRGEQSSQQSSSHGQSDEEEELSDMVEDQAVSNIDTLEDDLDYVDPQTKEEYTNKLSFVTIGMVGHPNAGKSSLINGLMGKKVVSTSSSPGHTKHLQTIFYNKAIRLCDCPGLTFPALDMPKPLQVLAGLFPIAQVREPYSAVAFLAERVAVEKIYGLTQKDPSHPWSAWKLCEAYAKKREYTTRHGAWDTYRAGNEILRDTVDGRVVLYFYPPEEASATESEVQTLPSDQTQPQDQGHQETLVVDDDDDDDDGDDSGEESQEEHVSIHKQNRFTLLEECP